MIATLKDTVRSLEAPESAVSAMEETDELLDVIGLLQWEVEQRVRQVDVAREAKAAGYSSTASWLRSNGRMHKSGAGDLRDHGKEFARLPKTVAAIQRGEISHGMAVAIAKAVKPLPDEDAFELEQILLNAARADGVTVEDITRLGKYKRNLLDQEAALKDDEKAHQKRYLSVHIDENGGIHGTFYLPPEPAAGMQAVLDKHAGPKTAGDTRTRCQRNADALAQLIAGQVRTELLVLVNAEALPDDNLDDDPETERELERQTPGLLLPTGHPYPAAHIKRLARTSTLYRMVVAAESKVLDLGDGVRLVPGWMRRAILAIYPTCAYDACPVEATHCQLDHVYDWAIFHRTRLDEIVPACAYHNRDRAKYPSKYTLTKRDDGRWHLQGLLYRERKHTLAA